MAKNDEGMPTHGAAHPTSHAAAIAEESASRRAWASVGAVAFGAFIILMTGTLPVGLLPQIAYGLHVSLG